MWRVRKGTSGMRNRKFTNISAYVRWFITQYQQVQQSREDAYRIIGVETDATNHTKLVVQVVGKSTTFKCTPEEIAADDRLLSLFSRHDVRTITYYACQEIKKPKHRIVMQSFCAKLNKMIFSILRPSDGKVVQKTADEISTDRPLLNSLSQADAHLVGYTSGTEQTANEAKQIETLLRQD